ncbi:MAG: PD40 domain-containing protein [Deltaproteobacteria bacterium]|nr:PD40 domain-containing protein [Deltaproteobacteria bacterium]
MCWWRVALPIAFAASCGRTALLDQAQRPEAARDAGQDTPAATPDLSRPDGPLADEPRPDSPADPPPAALRDGPADLPRERPLRDVAADFSSRDLTADGLARDLPGADLPRRDASAADAKPPDGAWPSTSCASLRALADQGVLTKARTRDVTFAPDRSWIVLKVRREGEPGIGYPDQLLHVALPSGEITMISDAGGAAEALGRKGGMLVVGADSDGKGLAVYENGALRTLATGACAHLAAPDGSRIYVIRDCTRALRGTLEVVEAPSGEATTLAANVLGGGYSLPDYAVSPGGEYFAFLVQAPDGDARSNVLHVADRSGKVYSLPSQPGATGPWFASDDLLLFGVDTGGYPTPDANLRAHVPGTGDTSYSLATGRSPGLFGYRISADRTWVLGAGQVRDDAGYDSAALLYAIRLDGTGENLLSSALLPFWRYENAINAFEWSGDGSRAVFVAEREGRIWASDPYGAAVGQISSGAWFRVAPVGDQVALLESAGDARQNHLRVLALGAGTEYSFVTDGSVTAPTFAPDGRGLLFASTQVGGARQLRYISASLPGSVVLGEWTETLLDMYPGFYGDPPGRYPMDPTGCFAVVDTDLPPGPGTRLVLLPEQQEAGYGERAQ